MPVAIAIWSHTLRPGEPEELVPPHDVVITNIALGDELEDEQSRTSVKLSYLSPVDLSDSDDEDNEEKENGGGQVETTVLCSLTPGKIEQANVNITLERDEEYLLQAVGKNTIYLTGNYVDQSLDNVPYNNESDDEDEDEDGYDLRDVSSDVEVDPTDMVGIEEDEDDEDDSHRFEEVPDEPVPKSAGSKRPRDSNVSATEEERPSKAQEKKSKKQKAANGEAVPVASSEKAEPAAEKKEKKEKKKAEQKEKAPVTKELAGGLKLTDMKFGTGPQAKSGQRLAMRYIGKLQNGKIFDQNTKGKPFEFSLGKGEVIKGWDEGLKGMQVGGERQLVIPPGLAYRNQKQAGIPPNSTLIFDVKLVSIK